MTNAHNSKEYSINSTKEINENLEIIRYKTHMKNVEILSQLLAPLAQILANQEKPSGFIIYTVKDQIVIQCYGMGNITFSGKATAPLGDILGVA
jgi:hypothetical protein